MPSSGKIRLPPPSRIGSIIRLSSSTSPSASSAWTRLALPQITRSPPSCARSAAMSRDGVVGRQQRRLFHVRSSWRQRPGRHVLLDGVHLVGVRVAGPLRPRRRHPLPRAPAEQQRVGRVHPLADRRRPSPRGRSTASTSRRGRSRRRCPPRRRPVPATTPSRLMNSFTTIRIARSSCRVQPFGDGQPRGSSDGSGPLAAEVPKVTRTATARASSSRSKERPEQTRARCRPPGLHRIRAGTTGAVGRALDGPAPICHVAPMAGRVPVRTHTANVLVIGSGGAGLRAAIAAHQAGAEVVVVGKRPRLDAAHRARVGRDQRRPRHPRPRGLVAAALRRHARRGLPASATRASSRSWCARRRRRSRSSPSGAALRPHRGRSHRPAVLRRAPLAAHLLRGRLLGPGDPAHAGRQGRRARHPDRRGALRLAAADRRRRLLRRARVRPARREPHRVRRRRGRAVRRRPHAHLAAQLVAPRRELRRGDGPRAPGRDAG